jgi:hypothetical protein
MPPSAGGTHTPSLRPCLPSRPPRTRRRGHWAQSFLASRCGQRGTPAGMTPDSESQTPDRHDGPGRGTQHSLQQQQTNAYRITNGTRRGRSDNPAGNTAAAATRTDMWMVQLVRMERERGGSPSKFGFKLLERLSRGGRMLEAH